MKNRILRFTAFTITTVAIALIFSGCSATKTGKSDPTMNYKFSRPGVYSYVQDSEVGQFVDVMGQETGSNIFSRLGFTVKGGELTGDKIPIVVTIDTLGINIKSPQGNIVESKDELKGRSFNMTISESGEKGNLDEAEKITYMVAGQSESNLAASFSTLFPKMPEISFKVGDTWNDSDTVITKTSTEDAQMIINSVNTFAGFEEYNGVKCIRVNYTLEGERSGTSITPQGEIGIDGDLDGEGHWLFDPERGVLVYDESSSQMSGYVSIPTGDSFPLMVNTKFTTRLTR